MLETNRLQDSRYRSLIFIFVFRPSNVDMTDMTDSRINSGFVLIENARAEIHCTNVSGNACNGNGIVRAFFKLHTIWESVTGAVLKKIVFYKQLTLEMLNKQTAIKRVFILVMSVFTVTVS